MALNVAVASPTIQAHGVVQEGNKASRSGTIKGQEIGVAFPTLLLQERVEMGMPKIMAVPNLPVGAGENQVRGKGGSWPMCTDRKVTGAGVEAARCEGCEDHIDLLGLVTLGGLQEFEQESSSLRRQSPGSSLGWGDVVDVAPAKGKAFRGPEPAEPEKELGEVGQEQVVPISSRGTRTVDKVGAVLEVPTNVLGSDGRRWARFGPKPTAHAAQGHAGEQVIGGRDAVRTKELILGTVSAPRGSEREGPGINRAKGRSQRAGTWVANKFLCTVGRGLESIMLHRPEQEDGIAVGRGGWQVPEMGSEDLKAVQEAMEPADVPLIAG
jgi:hypothetical protein